MTMTKTQKLIEAAMPAKEVSAESVRDKSIRHGHFSTLHYPKPNLRMRTPGSKRVAAGRHAGEI